MTTVAGHAGSERSIVVGGDVIRSILVTGDHNQVFVGDYELLRDAYIEPWSVFQRVDVEQFVGREWLTAEIDGFLASEDCGYFVLEAPAGVGKTAYLAHLVAERGYIHHFVELARGPDGVAAGLKSLAAQVVRAGELVPYSTEEVLPPAAGSRPDFFAFLLKRASDRRSSDQQRIVIVVDALDEAAAPVGHNALGLPEVLPSGVFIVVSQRPVPVRLDSQSPLRVFSLDAPDERNLQDMRRFLERAVAAAPLAGAVQASGHRPPEVVEALLRRSAGVWIYLHYVLADLGRGEGPLDLEVLPDGVWDYYARFWRRWRDERRDEWYPVHLPLLATIAVVQEDASADLLAALAGIQAGPALEALLEEQWAPLLAVSDGDERRYRPYHASLREFVQGRLDPGKRRAMDLALARELAGAARNAQERIADRYLERWGGFDDGLPALLDGAGRRLDGGYGFRHLTAHLAEAGRHEELDRLLRLETRDGSGPGNTWFTAHDATGDLSDYLADVARAWRLAEARSEQQLSAGQAADVAAQARYALHAASLNSLAGSIPPPVLVGLVAAKAWSPAKGLAYARQTPDENARAEALGALAPVIPAELQLELLGAVEALGADDLPGALDGLAEHLPDSLLARAAPVFEAAPDYLRTTATARLAERLASGGRWEQALELLSGCQDAQAGGLERLAARLPPEGLGAALELATGNPEAEARIRGLLALLPRLDGAQADAAQRAALATATELPDRDLVGVLAELAPWLGRSALGAALDHVRAWQSPWMRARALVILARWVPDGERAGVVQEALASARAVPVPAEGRYEEGWGISVGPEVGQFERADALGSLLPLLEHDDDERVREAAVAAARAAFDAALESAAGYSTWSYTSGTRSVGAGWRGSTPEAGSWYGAAPVLLASRLPPTEAEELVGSVLATATAVRSLRLRASILLELLADLTGGQREQAIAQVEKAASRIRDPEARSELLLRLLEQATGASRARIVERTMATLRRIESPAARLRILGRLAPFDTTEAVVAAARDEIAKVERLPSGITEEELGAVVPRLPAATLEELLRKSRVIDDEPARSELLVGLAPYLPAGSQEGAIARAAALGDEARRDVALERLAGRLAAEGHGQPAIRAAEALPDPANVWPSQRAEVLKGVAAALVGSDPSVALQAVGRISRDDDREDAIAAVLPRLPEEYLDEAISLVEGLGEPGPQSFALFALARRLDDAGRSTDATAIARRGLAAAIASLGHGQLSLADGDRWVGKPMLEWLADRLPAGDAERLRASVRSAVQELPDRSFKDQGLQDLDASEAAPEQGASVATLRLVRLGFPEEATAAVLGLSSVGMNWDDSPLTTALTTHVGNLAAYGYLDQARAAAGELLEVNNWGEHVRALALTDLAPRYVRAGQVRSGLECALAIRDDDDRSQALGGFADAAAALPPATLLPAVRTVLGRASRLGRGSLLSDLGALAPVIARVGGPTAAEGIVEALDDVARWWP